MTIERFLSFAAASLLTLSACNSEPETVTTGGADPQAEELSKAAPKQLPPSIVASRTYRCADNSVVFIDFMNDQKTAVFRSERNGSPTVLSAPEAGEPFIAEGLSLTGSGAQVTLARPGKGSQSCKA